MIVRNCTLIKALKCAKDTSIADVAKTLRENKQRRIIVVDDNEAPVGIISTTDINNRLVAEGKDANSTKAEDIMTSPIYLILDIDEGLDEAYEKMHEHNTFFVPVTKDGKLFAVLTYGELVARVKERLKNE